MFKRVLHGILILIATYTLVACSSEDPNVLPNDPPSASNVIIIDNNGGAAIVGDTLSGSYDYTDREGNDEGNSTFRWLRNGTPIAGATAINYTLVQADSGQPITFEVTPVAELGGNNAKAVTSTPIVINSAPTASGITISAPAAVYVGYTLTGNYIYNDADNDAEGVSTFRWLRNGIPITGATSITYTLVAADSGKNIAFEVIPVATTGMKTGVATVSADTIKVLNSAPVASSVSIKDDNGGIPLVGDSLTGSFSYSDIDGDPQGISTYRWLRDGTPIAGATAATYVLDTADTGALITFQVTPVAATGFPVGVSVISSSIVVNNSAPVATAVSITDNNGGNALVGDLLTGNYSFNDVDNDNEGISTYRWLRNGTAIPGATAQSYTLVTADSGTSIAFEVTPVAASGTATGSTVTSGSITVFNSAPTATAVNITDNNGGDALVGDVLAGNYNFNDVDNDNEGVSTFRWRRNGTVIPGATAQSYTLVSADSGSDITFEVTPVAITGVTTGSAVISGAITVANSAPTVSAVSITDNNGGDALVGDTLNGNYSFNDVDNDAEGTSTYRWLRNGSVITGATATTYTLITADSGATITFEVTPVATAGNTTGTAVISSGITVANSAPTASAVSITDDNGGVALVGDALTGNYAFNDVDNDDEGASTYRWLRNGSVISGATDATYTLVTADTGATITFEVTPVAATGVAAGTAVISSGITIVNSAPTATAVSITDVNGGATVVGDSLAGNYIFNDVDNDNEGTSTFRWLRNGAAIAGATDVTYTLVTADTGTTISFEVTPVSTSGATTGSAVASSGITVVNSAPAATSVSITDNNGGLALIGDTLTGNYAYVDPDGDPEDSSIFRWLRNGAAITGATTQSYTLVPADNGSSITFEVTPVAQTGVITGTAAVSGAVSVSNSAPTASAVSISDNNGGSVLVGVVLTGNYSFNDVDNDVEGISTFRWLRNGTAIPGATAQSYTLVTADSGNNITFEVTPVAATGTTTGQAVVSSGITVANSAPTATAVSISDNNGGEVLVGDVLTGNYNFNDVDNDAQGISTFRWLRNGTAITGATATTYTLVSADSGTSISFEVTPVAASGTTTGSAVASGGITVANSAPVATAVNISDSNGGDALVGDSLTGNYAFNDVDDDTEGTSTYRWLRNGSPITGATAITYTLVTADSGATITFEVTPVAVSGTSPGTAVSSATITVVNSAPTATAVGITDNNDGDVLVGDTLTGNYAFNDVDNDTEGTSTYRWLRNGSPITGATAISYTLITADSGTNITFEVTPVSVSGTSPGTAVSSAAITVVNSAPTATAVSITDNNDGDALVGDTLTGNYAFNDPDNDTEGSSTFRWLRDSSPITGATAITYTLVTADSGATITFEVTPVAAAGTTTGTAVISSGITVANSAPTATAVGITDNNDGDALVGDTLTGNYIFDDVDDDPEGTSTFRWLRNGTPIASATAVTYTLVSADSGASITFEVTPVADTGVSTGVAVVSAGITVVNSAPAATSVTITDDDGGAALIGDSLTGSYNYNDADGDTEGTTSYRWLRNGSVIAGATSTSYTVVSADAGTTITFEVTPVATAGTITGNAAVSAGLTISTNTAPTASGVSITDDNNGNAEVGDSLTGNYTYNDADGDAEGTTTFRWLRNGTAISGATSSSYTLVSADTGNTITFEVTPVALSGVLTGAAVASGGLTVANSAPTASAVSISDVNGGTPLVGDSLTGSYDFADVDGDIEGTSTYRWLRNGTPISSATALTYTLVTADSGTTITFEVTPVAATGTTNGAAVTSGGISVLNSAPSATGVSITDDNGGTAFVGESLTGNYTFNDVDDDLEAASSFRWLRNGAEISGATSINYTLVTADAGTTVTFEVTPVAATGSTTGTAVISSGITVSTNVAPSASAVSISDVNSGSVVVGDVLTGNYTFNDSDGDTEGTSTFRWLRNSVEISGATASSYTLVTADSGTTITFEVTPVSATGVTTGAAIVSSGVTVVNSAPTAIDVNITDENGGNALEGDDLTGSYTFEDVDDDAEGTSTFRWLRNSVAIVGATSSTYTLTAADVPAQITFEVTPVATSGILSGTATVSAALPTGTAPVVSGFARYLDSNLDGSYNANDELIVPFDQPVNTNTVTSSDFDLPVNSDGLGSGATVIPGPASNEVTIVLGNNPKLTLVGDFSVSVTSPNSPSGIDVDPAMMPEAIESASGIDALSSQPIDLIPGFVDSNQSLGSSNSQSIALGDINGDTYPDIVVANAGTQTNQIYFNDGSGNFPTGTPFGGNNDSQSIAVADIDGINGPDIIVANASGQTNQVYLNDGAGNFPPGTPFGGNNDSQSIAVADIDGINGPDIIVANAGTQANEIYLNDGTGNFPTGTPFGGNNDSQSIAVADVDGINGLDIIVANASGQTNQVYLNDGTGNFPVGTSFGGNNDSQSIAVADINGINGPDIIVANAGTQANQVYLNNGSGSFSAGTSFGTNDSQSIVLVNVDGDTDLDIIVANASGEANQVYLNDGLGNFTDSGQSLGTSDSQSLAVADVDADGDDDIAIANAAQGNTVYMSSLADN